MRWMTINSLLIVGGLGLLLGSSVIFFLPSFADIQNPINPVVFESEESFNRYTKEGELPKFDLTLRNTRPGKVQIVSLEGSCGCMRIASAKSGVELVPPFDLYPDEIAEISVRVSALAKPGKSLYFISAGYAMVGGRHGATVAKLATVTSQGLTCLSGPLIAKADPNKGTATTSVLVGDGHVNPGLKISKVEFSIPPAVSCFSEILASTKQDVEQFGFEEENWDSITCRYKINLHFRNIKSAFKGGIVIIPDDDVSSLYIPLTVQWDM